MMLPYPEEFGAADAACGPTPEPDPPEVGAAPETPESESYDEKHERWAEILRKERCWMSASRAITLVLVGVVLGYLIERLV